MKYIAGMDPGLANFGVAITDLDLNLVEFKCITTKKSNERYVAVDMFKRGQTIARELIHILNDYNIRLLCAESMSYPRSSSAAAKMAITWGIICLYSEGSNIPMCMVTPQNIKKSLTGAAKASKDDVKRALETMGYDLPKMNKTQYEHPCDALGAIIACQHDDVFRATLDNS